MILALDTSLGSGVAVVDLDGVELAEAASDNPLGHAEVIGDLIRRSLAEASVRPDQITHVAAGMGPGPFTGLRIGVAAARAFALARSARLVPVVSHDAAARTHFDAADADAPVAIVTDARRREFAYTVYAGLDPRGVPVRATEPALAPRHELDDRLREAGARRIDASRISAAALGRVAAHRIATGGAGAEDGMTDPLYLRAPDVTLGAVPKRVGT